MEQQMDESHRDLLRRNLVALTTDLDPRDVYVSLIEMGVLTMDDRENIRAMSLTRKEEAEELISVIQRKGPTAFEAFMVALQHPYHHLYDLLSRGHREIILQRQQNAVGLDVQADVNRAELKSQIENEILKICLISLRNVCRAAEATEYCAEAIGNILAELGRYGRRILGITVGSVVFCVECPSVEALDDLWELCQSGKLARMFQNAFVTDSFLQRHKVKSAEETCLGETNTSRCCSVNRA
ncbi:hypothetical protein CAPTEDRAFT_211634 [Capitella teleta]|uniref:CARD domain-containing protein n=1 Tax=Capitella teleta TaxID=283909 RepID=R7TJ91_CAPTE|nr:hypothetical protein CAPTEDRAFT_211634 [Capitella teleta]|eukprot:ELT91616.1 hypothetical protein CAPTEDRAFT_211634 [Capitella teleta]